MNTVASKLAVLVEKVNCYYLLAFLIATTWLRRCFGSLWLDEALAFWTINGSFKETALKAWAHQGQSPLYYLTLWVFSNLFGESEFFLRLPSLLAGLVSLYFLYQLTRRIFNSEVAIAASIIFVFLDGGLFISSNARPYGIALAAALASTHYFLKWFDGGAIVHQALHIFCSALAIYAHYFYGGIALAQFVYLITHWKKKQFSAIALVSSIFLVCGFLAPLLPHVQHLSDRSSYLGIQGVPPIVALVLSLLRPAVPFLLLTSIFYVQAIFSSSLELKQSIRNLLALDKIWLFAWFVIGPVCLFQLAYWSNVNSVYQDHYVFWIEPAFAIICAYLISNIKPKTAASATLLCFSILALIAEPFRPIRSEDWKGAASYIETVHSQQPIVYYSGLVESQNYEWISNPSKEDYLAAPLTYYGIEASKVILPYSPYGRRTEEDWLERIYPALKGHDEVLYIGTDVISFGGKPASKLFMPFFETHGLQVKEKRYFKKVWVATLVREQEKLENNTQKEGR